MATDRLIGNRLALVGAIVYLLEWVAILGANMGDVPAPHGAKLAEILATYSTHGTGLAIAASWFSLVLLGRILFVSGLREGLRRSGAQTLLADFAIAAMAVSVALEIAAFAVAAGGAQATERGAGQSIAVGIDAVANWLDMAIWPPFAVSILTASLGMLASRLFAAWLSWLGIVVGVLSCIYGLLLGPAFAVGGGLYDASQSLGLVAVVAWIWMLATGVVLFRAAGRQPA